MSFSPSVSSVTELLFFLILIGVACGVITLRIKGNARFGEADTLPGRSAEHGADHGRWRNEVQDWRMDLDGRVQAIEQSLRHVPSSTDFAELEGTVRTVQAQYESLAEGQKTIRNSLYRIEDFLLKGIRP